MPNPERNSGGGERKKIAVIGAGISGITASYLLGKVHDVTLFERNRYLGGHTNTRIIEEGLDDAGTPVDTGFIVCNSRNYPKFQSFLQELGVALRDSDMSFGYVCDRTGLQYMGPGITDFLQTPGNLLKPRFVGLLLEQQRFNTAVLRDLRAGLLREQPLREYLASHRVSSYFVENYLVPLIASIWSSPTDDALDFPMATFAAFFDNHGMLELSKRPQWQTVVGGSVAYVRAFERYFNGKIVRDAKLSKVSRTESGPLVMRETHAPEQFDAVVIATHADEALELLADPSDEERRLLGTWRYNRNSTTLHTDTSVMVGPKRLWASWNYRRRVDSKENAPVAITYYMNRLQGLKTRKEYLVTLNGNGRINPDKIVYQTDYTHPVYSPRTIGTQAEIEVINGNRDTWYCGAYLRYGFHEDGVRSALAITERFGQSL